jgi:uncharacterized protein with HEPN domain
MRREKLYLLDIIEAADAIRRFIEDATRESFLKDDKLQSSVLLKLLLMGEAASKLSADFRARHLKIEWTDIIGFRNIAVHAYFAVEWPIVWIAATQDAPELRSKIAKILRKESPEVPIPDVE